MLSKQAQSIGLVVAVAALLVLGAWVIHGERVEAQSDTPNAGQGEPQAGDEVVSGFEGIERAVAVVYPTAGNQTRGVVEIWQHGDHVHINAHVVGLEPNSRHGFHIHEYGDCTARDATSAGGHYNPEGHPHGLPDEHPRHAGDLGNLQADDEGVATLRLVVENITVAEAHNPILGRAVIVHEGEDDGSQPLGDAGARIGCGVLGVGQPRQ